MVGEIPSTRLRAKKFIETVALLCDNNSCNNADLKLDEN